MDILLYLIPAAVFLGLLGLLAFLWALKSGQFDDLDGAAHRILFDDDDNPNSPNRTSEQGRDNDNPAKSGQEEGTL